MTTRWEIEYSPKFSIKSKNLKSQLASYRLEKLCEWIANQTDPNKIAHCMSCAEEVNKKLYFPMYGWHIVFRFEGDTVVFVMFYNASDGKRIS